MNTFKNEVLKGLQQKPKKLSSKYFYDAKGDKLFQQIMQLDEYYLPKSELSIIKNHKEDIAKILKEYGNAIEILELGAGDGTKTVKLLEGFVNQKFSVKYLPFDISSNVLKINKQKISEKYNEIDVVPISGNYFKTYRDVPKEEVQRLVLFLGSNLGNYNLEEALDFLNFLKSGMKKNDHLIIAFDLVKHPRKIISAYDDSKGVTKQFNLNVLERINRELGADFNLNCFDHYPHYNPVTGVTFSYLISLKNQTVTFSSGEQFTFEKFEPIHTEISKKFFKQEIIDLSEKSELPIEDWFYDEEETYCFVLFKR
ncbi:MAG: L-histidine N(alpha)-methyltransferase [Flavobacteriaceae bacterium]